MAVSRPLSGMRYQKRPWLGCRHAPQTPSISFSLIIACGSPAPARTSSPLPTQAVLDGLQTRARAAVHLVLFDHRLRLVGAEAHVFPDAQEVDVGGILEPLTRLHDRAQRAGLPARDEPRVVLAAGRRP